MKIMALSDLVIMRRTLVQMAGIFFVIIAFLTISTGTVITATAAMAVMNPALFVVTIAAYDQLNQWESFRLGLPLNRDDVVKGRYLSTTAVVAGSFVLSIVASALLAGVFSLLDGAGLLGPLEYESCSLGDIVAASALGIAVSLWIPAVSLPLSLRFGLTRMTRFAPVFVALAVAVAFTAIGNVDTSSGLVSWLIGDWVFDFLQTGSGAALSIVGALALSALVFALTLPLSLRLYRTREF